MNSSDFRDDFINEIKSAAVTNMYSEQEAFFDIACDYISEAGEIQEFNRCYFNGKGRNGKTIQIDGYYFDTFSRELNLIICDYRSKFDTRELGITQIRKLVQDAIAFLENRDLLLNNIEESQQAYQFLLDLERIWPVINKTRVIILSTEKTKSIKKTEKFNIDEKEVYYNVWGIDRFEELLNNSSSSSKITINLLEHSEKGIPALYASNSKIYEYESYLTILPGNLLADLYDSYGAKLLEGNVRSFLSYRGKVNKAIRATLIGQPHMFFAFNNGIAATAADIETHSIEGELYIKSLTDFQIVNGGQTTASIFNVKHVRKEADLRDVYVPMKLNVVKNIDVAEKLIPIIAETANTQNKVNRADF
ncbi:MAG: AIPR family protein, partial [Candidatus Izemoplasmatales bacterium]